MAYKAQFRPHQVLLEGRLVEPPRAAAARPR
jgi:hypothetical protein